MVTRWRDWLPDWQSLLKIVFYVALLYVLQVFVILPFMRYVLDSDYFARTDVIESVNGERARSAQLACDEYIRREMGSARVEFPTGAEKIWSLGGGRYLIKASVIVTDSPGVAKKQHYACYIKYQGGDILDSDSWALQGLDWRSEESD
ncbi:MAG: hypothetical protein ACPW60_05150 [Methylohalobius sp. ZOD2]|nr:hypothetical protein [Methylothermaceae bacterium]